MHTEFKKESPALVSRREQADLHAVADIKRAFGGYCAALNQVTKLYPTQRLVAWFLGLATLKQGFTSISLKSLEELTRLDSRRSPFAGLGANDLSPAINGGWSTKVLEDGTEKRIKVLGLKDYGIVTVEPMADETVLMVIADSSQWSGVSSNGWRWAAGELDEWMLHVAALRQRPTRALQGLAVDADLHDARAMHAAEAVAARAERTSSVANGAARFSGVERDARERYAPANGDANASRRSECRNGAGARPPVKSLGNPPVIPNVGMSRARAAVKQFKQKQETETVQQLNSAKGVDDSSRLLRLLEAQFVRAHGAQAAAQEMSQSGACWRMVARRWPSEFEIQVGELRNFIDGDGKFKAKAWFYMQHYFSKAVGCDGWAGVCHAAKKSKESF